MKKLLLASVLAFGLPAVAYGQSDDLKKAQQGDVKAQYNVAIGYQFGMGGFPKDLDRAIKWYKLASDQGDMVSQFHLGLLYKYDMHPPNYEQAKYYLKLACQQNYDQACGELETTE